MAQNLSVPLAFACLLHLANEKVGDWLAWRILSVSAYFRCFFMGDLIRYLMYRDTVPSSQRTDLAPRRNLGKGHQL